MWENPSRVRTAQGRGSLSTDVPPNLPRPGSGPARLDPRVKLGWTLGAVVVLGSLPAGAWTGWVVLLGALVLLLCWDRTPVRHVVRRSLLALPFLLTVLPLLVQPDGLLRLQWILARAWLSAQVAAWLVATTAFEDLLRALRWARVPETFLTVLALLWRYLFLLGDEAARMVRAREARTRGHSRWPVRTVGRMAGTLLVRALERAHRVQLAMTARGYRGGPLGLPLRPLDPRGWTVLGAGAAVLILSWTVSGWSP